MGVTWPPAIKPIGWMKARSVSAMGDALMVPGPLPWPPDEPRPRAWIALLSQPVAVIEGQGGRLLPVWVGGGVPVWVGGALPVWLGRLGIGTDAVPQPLITIAVSSTRPGRAALDMVL